MFSLSINLVFTLGRCWAGLDRNGGSGDVKKSQSPHHQPDQMLCAGCTALRASRSGGRDTEQPSTDRRDQGSQPPKRESLSVLGCRIHLGPLIRRRPAAASLHEVKRDEGTARSRPLIWSVVLDFPNSAALR